MESIPKVASFYNLAIQAVCICVLDNAVYLNKEMAAKVLYVIDTSMG
jgi:hypothetical protein